MGISSQTSVILIQSVQETLESIAAINTDLKVLSINAKIQSARAGAAGAGFKVVANEMGNLASRTDKIIGSLHAGVDAAVQSLTDQEDQTRSRQFSQMAATCIDLVDRNLYERSCDVRWWATDSAIVTALTDMTKGNIDFASRRMGVLLDTYTVYFDLVLCDLQGKIIGNGRPERYRYTGSGGGAVSVQNTAWFIQAVKSKNGSEYGFEGPLTSVLANGQPALIYSCGVRAGGSGTGKLLGVLGLVFNWDRLAREVLVQAESVLSVGAHQTIEAFLCRTDGTIIACLREGWLDRTIPVDNLSEIIRQQGSKQKTVNGAAVLIGAGLSRGFETYKTGWVSVIMETLSTL
jgi:hypothetical protein